MLAQSLQRTVVERLHRRLLTLVLLARPELFDPLSDRPFGGTLSVAIILPSALVDRTDRIFLYTFS